MNKSEITKARIIQATKEEYLNNGYHATSLKSVAERLGTGSSIVTYHFGSVSKVIDEIFTVYYNNVLKELNVMNIENPLTYYFAFVLWLDVDWTADERYRRFFIEKAQANDRGIFLYHRAIFDDKRSLRETVLDKYNLSRNKLSPRMLDIIEINSSATRREVWLEYGSGRHTELKTSDDWVSLFRDVVKVMEFPYFSLMGIDREELMKRFDEAAEIVDNADRSKFTLF